MNYRASAALGGAAGQIIGFAEIMYDSGSEAILAVNIPVPLATTDRSVVALAGDIASGPGWIISGGVCRSENYRVGNATNLLGNNAVTPRGRMWVKLGMGRQNRFLPLCQDYLHDSPIPLGRFVDPGPSGGVGNIRDFAQAATDMVAGGVALAVPANATWKIHSFRVTYASTAAVGSRAIRRSIRSPDGDTKWLFDDDMTLTASQNGLLQMTRRWGAGYDTSGHPGFSAVSSSMWPIEYLPEGWDFFIDDAADIDTTTPFDTVTFEGTIEEWLETTI